MSITIELPSKIERVLRERAKLRGKPLSAYLEELLNQEVELSFEELVLPIHEQTKRLGLTEKDVEELVDSELAALRREKPLHLK